MNKVSPIIGPITHTRPTNININIDTISCDEYHIRKRNTTTPSPPLTPQIHIIPPPPTPVPVSTVVYLPPLPSYNKAKHNNDNIDNNKHTNTNHYITIKDDIDTDIIEQVITDIKKSPTINLRYDRLQVHDYIYSYILFAYNFYSPIFTMYITIITYKQMNVFSSVFKNVVIMYAMIYPLIAMFILLHEAYYIYCKKFIYYKLMDNGVIFKWKKEYLYKSRYFWWYILSLIFICIGINDSWNVLLMFINQTSNLCIYIHSAINIESTLITLNGFFEDNIVLQTENIKKITWIDEDKLRDNVYGMIELRKIMDKKIDTEVRTLVSRLSAGHADADADADAAYDNICNMENFEKYKKYLNTRSIMEYYTVMEKCNLNIDIIGKIKINMDGEAQREETLVPCLKWFGVSSWSFTLLNELKRNHNMYWNHPCAYCNTLNERNMNYYLCIICRSYFCETCNDMNTNHSLKTCYMTMYMDHKTIHVYKPSAEIKNQKENNTPTYPLYYKLFYHHELDNTQIISILDTIYYLSILSIFMIEFYGFYIIF
jgi:hypothetical protein